MRFFAIEGDGTSRPRGPLRVVDESVGEGNLEDPIGHRPSPLRAEFVTETELLAMPGGQRALELWRAGDDSAHVRAVADELAIDALDDELEGRG
jgi:hypothetical protein